MEYKVVLEHEPRSGHVVGTVLGIPSIVVDGRTEREALVMVRKAIRLYLEESRAEGQKAYAPVDAKLVSILV